MLLLRCLVLWLALSTWAQAENKRLFLLHTNDIHGYIESYEEGGLERIASLVSRFRELYPDEVVLLDGGDTSLGTPLSGTFHGKPTAELMASMSYDAVALGNHEFNWGKDKMRALTQAMKAPILCANLVTEDGGRQPYPGFTVITRNGVKLGIIGLVTPDTPRRAPVESTKGWKFLNPAQAARVALAGMPTDLDAVISLNHLGVEADRNLASQVSAIDLIVGGHSHTALHKARYQGRTPILQAGCYGRFLGVAELRIDTDKNTLTLVGYRLIPATIAEPDPEAHKIVERYAAELRPLLNRRVATVSEKLDRHAPKNSYDTPLGNFITDVFRHQASTDIALYNRGGARFSMEPGALTVAKVFELFPFDDPVNVLEATGEQLIGIVEQGTVDGEGPLSASGLTAVIRDGKVTQVRVGGRPIDSKRVYTVATTRFLSDGGDGMATLASLKRVRTLPFTRDVLLSYLKTHSDIRSPGAGRLTIK